jgi:hypothetical protein
LLTQTIKSVLRLLSAVSHNEEGEIKIYLY